MKCSAEREEREGCLAKDVTDVTENAADGAWPSPDVEDCTNNSISMSVSLLVIALTPRHGF